jgi:hypothetical protein
MGFLNKKSSAVAGTTTDGTASTGHTSIIYSKRVWFIGFIICLLLGLSIALIVINKEKDDLKTTQYSQIYRNSNWPDSTKDQAFSIRLQGSNSCLQPPSSIENSSLNGKNLTLGDSCDEDNVRFKKLTDNKLQQHIPYSKNSTYKQMCLKPLEGTIIYNNSCDDSVSAVGKDLESSYRYTYENNIIKHDKTGKCFKIENSPSGKIVKLSDKDCDKFDLI